MSIYESGNPDIARSTGAFWFNDDKGKGLVDEIWAERKRQIESGYTHEHDDEHGIPHMVGWAQAYLGTAVQRAVVEDKTDVARTLLVQAAALIVAAIEAHDRAES